MPCLHQGVVRRPREFFLRDVVGCLLAAPLPGGGVSLVGIQQGLPFCAGFRCPPCAAVLTSLADLIQQPPLAFSCSNLSTRYVIPRIAPFALHFPKKLKAVWFDTVSLNRTQASLYHFLPCSGCGRERGWNFHPAGERFLEFVFSHSEMLGKDLFPGGELSSSLPRVVSIV